MATEVYGWMKRSMNSIRVNECRTGGTFRAIQDCVLFNLPRV